MRPCRTIAIDAAGVRERRIHASAARSIVSGVLVRAAGAPQRLSAYVVSAGGCAGMRAVQSRAPSVSAIGTRRMSPWYRQAVVAWGYAPIRQAAHVVDAERR